MWTKKNEIEWLNDELEFERKAKKVVIDACNKALEIKDKEVKKLKDEIEKLKEGIKWRDDGIRDLEDEIDKKNEEIEKLNEVIADLKNFLDDQKATIKRQNQRLTEHELYKKKAKETAPTGVPAIDATVDRLIRLEAKYEAHENPYFF